MTGDELTALASGIVLWTFIGAVCLRGAVALYNKVAGGVPEPGFGKALGIMLAAAMARAVVGYAIGLATGAGITAAGYTWVSGPLVPQIASLAAGVAVLSALLWRLLPTTPARAILVTLCYVLAVALVAVAFIGISRLSLAVALWRG